MSYEILKARFEDAVQGVIEEGEYFSGLAICRDIMKVTKEAIDGNAAWLAEYIASTPFERVNTFLVRSAEKKIAENQQLLDFIQDKYDLLMDLATNKKQK